MYLSRNLKYFISFGRIHKQPINHLCTNTLKNNILIEYVKNESYKLPPFNYIRPADFQPAILSLLDELHNNINKILINHNKEFSNIKYNNKKDFLLYITRLNNISEPLNQIWNLLNHLLSVQNSEELREINNKLQPKVIDAFMKLSQNEILYEKLLLFQENLKNLTETEERILKKSIQNAKLNGVGLSNDKKNEFDSIQLRLAELRTKFSNNALDSTKDFSLLITDKKQLNGFPDFLLLQTANNAARDGHIGATAEKGPWKLTLDAPCYLNVLKFGENTNLREIMYKAYAYRCSEKSSNGKFNNVPIIKEILELRNKKAQLLLFNSYADYSIETKMANNVREIYDLHEKLRTKCMDFSKKELKELSEFVSNEKTGSSNKDSLKLWDIPYWIEKKKKKLFTISDDVLKEYFPLNNVLNGLFSLSSELFNIQIKENNSDNIQVWDKEVKYFDIVDNISHKKIAGFYLDPFSRPENKKGGAWMNICLSKDNNLRKLPIAYLICNISTPTKKGMDSLMSFREVETLFHEFGHGLQHMLTTVTHPLLSGINGVEWDAVEIPSQFMEKFCYDKNTINKISKHIKTGMNLPDHLFKQLVLSKKFMAATNMLRQLCFGYMDLILHDKNFDYHQIFDTAEKITNKYCVIPPLKDDRFLCSFSHIFAGGYAAGYYSYIWAEILSCDAFGAFEDAGLENRNQLTLLGSKFKHTFLEKGGSQHPHKVFESFRGRSHNIDSFIRAYGLE